MVAEKFQIYSVKITADTFVSQKIEPAHFYSCPPSKTLLQVFIIIPQTDGNGPVLPSNVFWRYLFSWGERGGTGDGLGEDYGVEKITKIDKGIGHKFW